MCVEELVSRLHCSTFFLFLTIDTLYRGPRLTRTFLQCSEKYSKRYPRKVNFGPLIGGTLAHAVNFFCYDKFPVTRKKSIFGEISKFYFREVGQGTVTKIFSLMGLGRPRIMNAKIWPRPLRIWRKWGSNFLGVEQFQLPGGNIVGVVV